MSTVSEPTQLYFHKGEWERHEVQSLTKRL